MLWSPALTLCGWCVCRCCSEQFHGCVGLACAGRQHVSPAQQRCHGSDLNCTALPSYPTPNSFLSACKLGTAVTVSPSNPLYPHWPPHQLLTGRVVMVVEGCQRWRARFGTPSGGMVTLNMSEVQGEGGKVGGI